MNAPATEMKPLAVDRETAAAMCGVSAKMLRRAVIEKRLKACKQGSRVTFLVEDLLKYLRNCKEGNAARSKRRQKSVKKK